nr:MAG TPA: hypothetical protein [Caudoviricetes sp.]
MAEYIEREELRKTLETWRDAHADVDDEEGWELLEDVLRELNAQAAADVAPVVHGRWERYSTTMMVCSICGKHVAQHRYSYCPNCGAKMDGDSDG